MTDKIEAATRKQVAELMPTIINKVIGGYQNLINAGVEKFQDTKNHKAYYESCKGAVMHLQVLLKLAEWAEITPEKSGLSQKALDDVITTLNSQMQAQTAAYDDEGEVV
jgi:hypothetical protein